MEIQITDFENAAFSIFIVLLTRAILSFKLNLYLPISKVDENMRVAHNRDAALADKFWFRKQVFPSSGAPDEAPTDSSWAKLSIDAIINGDGDNFAGLIPLIESYLNSVNCDVATRCELGKYLDLVSYRASGKLCTASTWIRSFVRSHPAYKKDSVISEVINYDLIKAVQRLSNPHGRESGVQGAEAFLGKFGL